MIMINPLSKSIDVILLVFTNSMLVLLKIPLLAAEVTVSNLLLRISHCSKFNHLPKWFPVVHGFGQPVNGKAVNPANHVNWATNLQP
jgi:hypothetical protein